MKQSNIFLFIFEPNGFHQNIGTIIIASNEREAKHLLKINMLKGNCVAKFSTITEAKRSARIDHYATIKHII